MAEELMHMPSAVVDMLKPEQLAAMGTTVRHYAVQNNLLVQFKEDAPPYCMVEGWQFAGGLLGLTPISHEPVKTSEKENIYVVYHKVKRTGKNGQVYFKEEILYLSTLKWEDHEMARWRQEYQISRELVRGHFNYKCGTDIVRASDGQVMARGFATCSNLEEKKVTFDEYAIASMAQTRSIGKGFRSLLGWVMKSAGIATTPLEEMEGMQPEVVSGKPEAEDGRQDFEDEKMPKLIDQLKTGKITLDVVDRHYRLTDKQRADIDAALSKQAEATPKPEAAATAQPAAPEKKTRRKPSKSK